MHTSDSPIADTAISPAAAVDRSAGRRWLGIGLWTALVVALLAHFYGLYAPGEPGAVEWFPNSDKVLHFLGFAIPTSLAVLIARRWWPLALFAAHAVISEIVQSVWLPGRDGDPLDALADLTGVLAAFGFCWFVRRPTVLRSAGE
ncbi:MAG: hypothetical protein QM711_02380 [Micropruina sp.]|uniref:hypothetical protein n=1 Tax=Micropruina sp. TaxID=2737536 RepID=UPI0039E5759B